MPTGNYLAAVGTIRALECELLREAEVEKMLGAKSFQEAFQMLHDLSFAKFIPEVKGEEDFEKVLNMGLYETKMEIIRLVPNRKRLDVLWLQYDLHNAKVLLKSKLQKNDPETHRELLVPYGKHSPEKLVQIMGGDISNEKIERWIYEAFQAAVKIYEDSGDPLQAECVLDEHFFDQIRRIAMKQRNAFVIAFVQKMIDSTNILTAFRYLIRKMENPPYIKGGSISKDALQGESIETFADNIPSPWKDEVRHGIEIYEKKNQMSSLENKLAELILESFHIAKTIIDGPEPLMAFFWMKRHNANILRTILVGKRAGFTEDQIRSHLARVF